MVSWHKTGQAVTPIGGRWRWVWWRPWHSSGPAMGTIVQIRHVHLDHDGIWFRIVGWGGLFSARSFRPVYPTIIDQLRKLDTPSPEHVKEDAL